MTKDEVLKLALEALETKGEHHPRVYQAITAIKKALAQPEQEHFMASYEFKQYGYYKDGKGTLKLGNIPATQPPQRTWVGLTYEEAKEIYTRIHGYDSSKRIAEAIEAKLKEKNT